MVDLSNKKAVVADPSKKAESILDFVLDDTSEATIKEREIQSSIKTELTKKPIVAVSSNRVQSRVLFLTSDLSVLQENSLQQLHFKNIASEFNEVHIIVVCDALQAKRGVNRLDKNLWVYTTSAKYWWLQTFTAQSIARSELYFADGFRPDLVVALDPFDAGMCGIAIAEKYKRALQLHVSVDFFSNEFKTKEGKEYKRKVRIANQVLRRVQSVRTSTMALREKIQKQYPKIKDVAVLPKHYDIVSIIEASQAPTAVDAFPQYAFVALFVGKLDHESTLFRTLDACRSILQSKSIVLVVVGEGPAKKEFQQRAEILGIQQQVVFQADESKLISYLQSADVLVCTDTSEESDELVIKSSGAGLPILMAKTPLREDLFTDGESAFLCDKEDTLGFSQKLSTFLNSNALRVQFSENARDVIKTRLHEDPTAFKRAYRDSIEGVFVNLKS